MHLTECTTSGDTSALAIPTLIRLFFSVVQKLHNSHAVSNPCLNLPLVDPRSAFTINVDNAIIPVYSHRRLLRAMHRDTSLTSLALESGLSTPPTAAYGSDPELSIVVVATCVLELEQRELLLLVTAPASSEGWGQAFRPILCRGCRGGALHSGR
jgi:hypothetical protein